MYSSQYRKHQEDTSLPFVICYGERLILSLPFIVLVYTPSVSIDCKINRPEQHIWRVISEINCRLFDDFCIPEFVTIFSPIIQFILNVNSGFSKPHSSTRLHVEFRPIQKQPTTKSRRHCLLVIV
jgi:hypothetical protein